jgi:hypothetical protein
MLKARTRASRIDGPRATLPGFPNWRANWFDKTSISFWQEADLVEIGLVASLARPGGNLTGFVASAPEGAAKRFEIMKEIRPQARRVAVLWNPTNSNANLEWNFSKEFAAANGLEFALYGAHDVDELRNALADLANPALDRLVVLNQTRRFDTGRRSSSHERRGQLCPEGPSGS